MNAGAALSAWLLIEIEPSVSLGLVVAVELLILAILSMGAPGHSGGSGP